MSDLTPGVTCFRLCGPNYQQALMCSACPHRKAPEPRLRMCSTWTCLDCWKEFRRYPGTFTPIRCPECEGQTTATCSVADARAARARGEQVWPDTARV